MRIISQDGHTDCEYENVTLSMEIHGTTIYEIQAAVNNRVFTMATYNSQGKAEKALNLLRNQYAGAISAAALANGSISTLADKLSDEEADEYTKLFSSSFLFKFPSNKDISI